MRHRLPIKSLLFSLGIAMLVWGMLLSVTGFSEFAQVLGQNWPVALTMVFGSFIAGATSEGGGAVAFPVFTKLLGVSAQDAKVFSLAIQSVGMSAASLTIIALRIPVEWRVIRWVSAGGLLGLVIGATSLTSLMSSVMLKMTFTMLVTSFAFTLYLLNRRIPLRRQAVPNRLAGSAAVLFTAGLVGGMVSGLVGNGIDIIAFSVMVLLFRISEKIATPTSVVLMAVNAIAGFALHYFVIGGFNTQVASFWIASIPVVVIGAPLGAIVCAMLNRRTIARVLIGLIGIELVSSLLILPLNQEIVLSSAAIFAGFLSVYLLMYRYSPYAPAAAGEVSRNESY